MSWQNCTLRRIFATTPTDDLCIHMSWVNTETTSEILVIHCRRPFRRLFHFWQICSSPSLVLVLSFALKCLNLQADVLTYSAWGMHALDSPSCHSYSLGTRDSLLCLWWVYILLHIWICPAWVCRCREGQGIGAISSQFLFIMHHHTDSILSHLIRIN